MPTMPGPLELMVIAALALIVLGPKRLPEIARSIGKAVNEFRRQAADIRSEFDLQMDEEEGDDPTPAHGQPSERPDAAPGAGSAATAERGARVDADVTGEVPDDPGPGPSADKS